MDITPKSKKVMNKDDVSLLVDLIQCNPALTSKETNATTNKCKEEAWAALVISFNARSGSIPRTKEQLKLKWDNLKKAARKRAQVIRMNNLKTGGGKPELIPGDEMLDRVSSLLGSTCTGFVVPFGGDGIGGPNVVLLDSSEDFSDTASCSEGTDAFIDNDARSNVQDIVEVLDKTPNIGLLERKRKFIEIPKINSSVGESSHTYFGMPMSDRLQVRKGKKKENDGRLARNLAIADYLKKKAEKVDLEIKKIKLEEKEIP